MKSVSFTMLKAEKAGLWQTPQTLRQEDFSWLLMLLCDGFKELRICHESCIYPTSHCLFRSRARMNRALHKASPCWKNIRTFITCASSMSCQSCQLMWAFRQQSSSYRSPVPKRGHICRCQPMSTVREPFSLQFQFSLKVQINEECLLSQC